MDWLFRAEKRIIEVKNVATLEFRSQLRDIFKVLDNTKRWNAVFWLRPGSLDRASRPLLKELIRQVGRGRLTIHKFEGRKYLGEFTVDAMEAILRAR